MYYTHCQNCGRKLTSTANHNHVFDWQCWKKIIDNTPGLFDDDTENEADTVKGQSISRPCKRSVRARQALLCSLPQVGRRWRKATSCLLSQPRRQRYFRQHGAAMPILSLRRAPRKEQRGS